MQVSTVAGDRQDASTLAYSAVTARLAASASVVQVPVSVYWFRGEVGEAEAWQVDFQTTAQLYARLEAHLVEHHPREQPEVWAVELAAAPAHHLRRITEAVEA
jgi:periplasmic divalent cation tolerance protein